LPVIVTTVKSSLVLTVKLKTFQYGSVQLCKILGMADGNIAINAIVFLEINSEFQYGHAAMINERS
jgi:hypothetical protein